MPKPDHNAADIDAPVPAPAITGQRVLVVDDDEIIRMVLGALLTREAVEFDVAVNGGEAVEISSLGNYGLILMDCEMPDMDGVEATRRIRQREGQRVPIIGVTAHALAEAQRVCLDAGMDGILTKPIDPEALRAILRRSLHEAR